MSAFLLFFLLVVPAVLLVHEIGHLMVARWCGVRVLRLSIGLGPELLGFTDWNGTRWALAVFPFGGSLELSDDRNSNIGPAAHTFSNKSLSQRAGIFAAGPLLSLLFAVAIYGLSFVALGEVTLPGTEIGQGEITLLGLMSGFSLSVGLFSLLPIPPLDGGWLALFGIEALTGKPIPESLQKTICAAGISMIFFATMILVLFLAGAAIKLGIL